MMHFPLCPEDEIDDIRSQGGAEFGRVSKNKLMDGWISRDDLRIRADRAWQAAEDDAIAKGIALAVAKKVPLIHTTGSKINYIVRDVRDAAWFARILLGPAHGGVTIVNTREEYVWNQIRTTVYMDRYIRGNRAALQALGSQPLLYEPTDDDKKLLERAINLINRHLLLPGTSDNRLCLFDAAIVRADNDGSLWEELRRMSGIDGTETPEEQGVKRLRRQMLDALYPTLRNYLRSDKLVIRSNRFLLDILLSDCIRPRPHFDQMLLAGAELDPASEASGKTIVAETILADKRRGVYFSVGRAYPDNFGVVCLGYAPETMEELHEKAIAGGHEEWGHFTPFDSGALHYGYLPYSLPAGANATSKADACRFIIKETCGPLKPGWRENYLGKHLARYKDMDPRKYFSNEPPQRDDPYLMYPSIRAKLAAGSDSIDSRGWTWEIRVAEKVSLMECTRSSMSETQGDIMIVLRDVLGKNNMVERFLTDCEVMVADNDVDQPKLMDNWVQEVIK